MRAVAAALALLAVLAVVAAVVVAQPVSSPWWTYADADAAYTASALNLLLGREVTYLDHPGLPITEVVAIAFGIEALMREASLGEAARLAFVDRTLLDLDSARPMFRGFAVAFYALGAIAAFLVAARSLGHWVWGLAGGILWIAAPGLVPMSIQLRPDVPLALLTLLFAFAIGRAVLARSAGWFALAAAIAGFTLSVKLHAIALVPALALAALWRPASDERVRAVPSRIRAWVRTHRRMSITLLVAWLVPALLLNAARFPFEVTLLRVAAVVGVVTAVAGAFAAAIVVERIDRLRLVRRIVNRHTAMLLASFVGGLLVPLTLSVSEGALALVYIAGNLSGRGVQTGIEPFSTPLTNLPDYVGFHVMVVFALSVVAAGVGIVRRDPRPVVWTAAAVSTAVLVFVRPPAVHYFAPSFVLAMLATLWLFAQAPRARGALLALPLALYVAEPAWSARGDAATAHERFTGAVVAAQAYVEARLVQGEVAIVPSYWPFEDSRYFELVEIYVPHSPKYPYRYLPATQDAREYAAGHRLRPRFFIGPQVVGLAPGTRTTLGDFGSYGVRPIPTAGIVAEIVRGPGVTEPW